MKTLEEYFVEIYYCHFLSFEYLTDSGYKNVIPYIFIHEINKYFHFEHQLEITL